MKKHSERIGAVKKFEPNSNIWENGKVVAKLIISDVAFGTDSTTNKKTWTHRYKFTHLLDPVYVDTRDKHLFPMHDNGQTK